MRVPKGPRAPCAAPEERFSGRGGLGEPGGGCRSRRHPRGRGAELSPALAPVGLTAALGLVAPAEPQAGDRQRGRGAEPHRAAPAMLATAAPRAHVCGHVGYFLLFHS